MKKAVVCLFVPVVMLMAVISAQPLLAQDARYDLILTLFPDDYYRELSAGEDNRAFLEIRNTGTEALTNIRLSAEAPEGWIVSFQPSYIGYLGYRSVETVDVTIKPNEKTAEDTYRVTLIAGGDQVRKVNSVWVKVKAPAALWLWVGAGIGVVIIAVFVAIYLRSGRQ